MHKYTIIYLSPLVYCESLKCLPKIRRFRKSFGPLCFTRCINTKLCVFMAHFVYLIISNIMIYKYYKH